MNDVFEKVLEGLPKQEVDRMHSIQRRTLTKECPAFVLSTGNQKDIAMSVYYIPEGETETVGDILFRLPNISSLKEMFEYIKIVLEEGLFNNE